MSTSVASNLFEQYKLAAAANLLKYLKDLKEFKEHIRSAG